MHARISIATGEEFTHIQEDQSQVGPSRLRHTYDNRPRRCAWHLHETTIVKT